MKRVQGRVAIVTGGAQGIGAAISRGLADEGAIVVIADKQDGSAFAQELRDGGATAEWIEVDVASEHQVTRLFDEVAERHGRIDLLVNNAGIGTPVARIVDTTLEDWERTMRINLTGTMLCTREALRRMPETGGGAILNVSSNVGKRGLSHRSAYVCSKWAMNGFTQTAALEGAPHGIRVNAILPGNVDTPHLREVVALHAQAEGRPAEDFGDELKALSPMNRYVELDELASAAIFLLSDESSAMTGQLVNVTAGWIMH